MNKKAFTLVELLAVISVLAIILLVTLPTITKTLQRNSQNEYNRFVESLELATETYLVENRNLYPDFSASGDRINIEMTVLINYGLVEKDTINPKTKRTINGDDVMIVSINDLMLFEYEFVARSESDNLPIITILKDLVEIEKGKAVNLLDYVTAEDRYGNTLIPTFSISDTSSLELGIYDIVATVTDDKNLMTRTTMKLLIYDETVFEYAGKEQVFTAPRDGVYKIELWGASGGDAQTYVGGNGGFVSGIYQMKKGQQIYVNVGGAGASNCTSTLCEGGYNGGGKARYSASSSVYLGAGGGATHVSTVSGLLSSLSENRTAILAVAGGGGGATMNSTSWYGNGGYGGSFTAGDGEGKTGNSVLYPGVGGTQTAGGLGLNCVAGTFGAGGTKSDSLAGGGAGYYGGGCGWGAGGGGGSNYIYGLASNNLYLTESHAGNESMPTHDETSTMIGNKGNGYAKIRYFGETIIDNNIYEFPAATSSYTFIAPKTGNYKLEVWGASGGDTYSNKGGNGGYATGTYRMSLNDKIYITVGTSGNSQCYTALCVGGYNGGGNGGAYTSGSIYQGSGGGATHIALVDGLLATLSSNKESILIVAGGGGGGSTYGTSWYGDGAAGGGLTGINATSIFNSAYPGLGGTQTAGGAGPNCIAGTFGAGGTRTTYLAGGGAGYYGGGCGWGAGGGGGSSYLSSLLSNSKTINGNSIMPAYGGVVAMTGNDKDGFARITYLGD